MGNIDITQAWRARLDLTLSTGFTAGDCYLIFGDIATTYAAVYCDFASGELGAIDSAGGDDESAASWSTGSHVITLDVIAGVGTIRLDGVVIQVTSTIDWFLVGAGDVIVEIENAVVGAITYNRVTVTGSIP